MSEIEPYVSQIVTRLRSSDREGRDGASGVYALRLTDAGERIVLYVGADDVRLGEPDASADVEVRILRQDLVDLATGRLNPMTAFMAGRIELSGDADRALRLWSLLR